MKFFNKNPYGVVSLLCAICSVLLALYLPLLAMLMSLNAGIFGYIAGRDKKG